MSRTGGFTVVELIMTIVIIGILTTLALTVPTYFQKTARDNERADDVSSIARRLEQAYNAQETGGPSYPTTTKLLSDIGASTCKGTGTVQRLSADTFKAPNSATCSVVAATSTSTSTPAGAGTPTLMQYVYQPLTSSSSSASLCTGSSTCVRFNLYYRRESDNSIQVIESLHQQ